MASVPSKLYADDVSLLMVLLDTNPFFWSSSSLPFSKFLSHVLTFLNSILLLNQLNQVVVIATGYSSCSYIYDSDSAPSQGSDQGRMPALCSNLLQNLEEFVAKDEQLLMEGSAEGIPSSLLSGSLSMALCYIQRVFRSGPQHPHPRILCLQGSSDGPEQYVAIMNAIFSAQRSMVPIDSCYMGSSNSAFLQQASYITGGVYLKPQQPDGLLQYLTTVFATDLHSRAFLQLPKSSGVDFRASHWVHLFCVLVHILQASQEMFNLWVSIWSSSVRSFLKSQEKKKGFRHLMMVSKSVPVRERAITKSFLFTFTGADDISARCPDLKRSIFCGSKIRSGRHRSKDGPIHDIHDLSTWSLVKSNCKMYS